MDVDSVLRMQLSLCNAHENIVGYVSSSACGDIRQSVTLSVDEYLRNERSAERVGSPLFSYNEEEEQLYDDVVREYKGVLSTGVRAHAYFPLVREDAPISARIDHD